MEQASVVGTFILCFQVHNVNFAFQLMMDAGLPRPKARSEGEHFHKFLLNSNSCDASCDRFLYNLLLTIVHLTAEIYSIIHNADAQCSRVLWVFVGISIIHIISHK